VSIRVARDAVHKRGCSQRKGQFPWQLKDQTQLYVPELPIRPQKREKRESAERKKTKDEYLFMKVEEIEMPSSFQSNTPQEHTHTHTHTVSPSHSESAVIYIS